MTKYYVAIETAPGQQYERSFDLPLDRVLFVVGLSPYVKVLKQWEEVQS